MIPDIDPRTGYLPPGEYEATWEEFSSRFGGSERRQGLLRGLEAALSDLANADIPRVYVDGSFVSSKRYPGDYEVAWDHDDGTDFGMLDPIFVEYDWRRLRQKGRYGGEFFPADAIADERGTSYRQFFQQDTRRRRRRELSKGIVVINLREWRTSNAYR